VTQAAQDRESGVWVGRDAELQRLRALVRAAAAGTGAAALIEGEPGSGRTALLSLAAHEAEACGLRVLRGAADEIGREIPLLVWRECLPHPEPDSADPRAHAEPDWISTVVRRLCATAPLLLAIDDLQWADEASLLAWQRLAVLTRELPLLLVATRWPTSPAANAAPVAGSTVLRLGPLTPTEAGQLVNELAGATAGPRLARLTQGADGNPRLLHELVAALHAEGSLAVADGVAELAPGTQAPAPLLETVASRLAALLPEAHDTLRLAALLGTRFGVAELAGLHGRDPAQLAALLDEQTALGILADAGGSRMRFRKPLIREALYAGIPVALRAVLHRRAAQILDRDGATVEQVARHLAEAGDVIEGWPLDWLAEHARALVLRAPVLAQELLRRVVDRTPNDDPHAPALWRHLSGAAYRIGHPDALELTRRLRVRAADPVERAAADLMLGDLHLRHGDPGDALDLADQVLETFADGAGAPPPWPARFLGLRAHALCYQGRYTEAERLAELSLEHDGGLGDPPTVFGAQHVHWRARLARRDHPGALAAVDAGIAAVRSASGLACDAEVPLAAARALLLGDLDRRQEAQAQIEQARALGLRTHALAGLGIVAASAAVLHYAAGRWDAALAELDAFDDSWPPDSPAPGAWLRLQTNGLAALILAHRGRDDEADARLDRVAGLPIPAGSPRSRSGHLLMARALRAEADGRPADALAALAVALDPQAARDLEQRATWLPDIVRLALAIGDEACAAAAVSAAEEEAVPWALARMAAAQRCRGLLAQDIRPLLEARGFYEATARPLELARTVEDLAAVTAARGDAETARSYLNQAVDAYAQLGAEGDIARADTRLRALGVRRGRRRAATRPGRGWAALTPTEVKVAGLVAKGRSNREIAVTLSLSPRTVQTHVSHILAKLGAGSRSQIAREAATRLPVAVRSARPDEV
jgi:DNA-binding CsgD family transcriptional regulator